MKAPAAKRVETSSGQTAKPAAARAPAKAAPAAARSAPATADTAEWESF